MATKYWVSNSDGNWSDTSNWSTSSGGTGGVSVIPTIADTAIFDSGGSGDCTVNGLYTVGYLDLTSSYSGTFKLTSYPSRLAIYRDLDLRSGTTIDLTHTDSLLQLTSGFFNFATFDGTITGVGEVFYSRKPMEPGTYDCNVRSGDANYPRGGMSFTKTVGPFPSGDFVFNKEFRCWTLGSGPVVWDMATNNPNLTFKGDVVQTGGGTGFGWDAGTGTITFDNTAAQSIDFDGETIEAVVVSDASTSTITLQAGFTTPYVHDCNDLIDENGHTVTETGTDPNPCSSGVTRRRIDGFENLLVSGGLTA